VGRLENRLKRLEEHDDRVGYAAAVQRLDDEDGAVLYEYMLRWEAEGGERVTSPYPTPREAAMLQRLHELRRQAIREGWGASGYRAY
jgi:hypothetical protein